jgi:hypothetical protein
VALHGVQRVRSTSLTRFFTLQHHGFSTYSGDTTYLHLFPGFCFWRHIIFLSDALALRRASLSLTCPRFPHAYFEREHIQGTVFGSAALQGGIFYFVEMLAFMTSFIHQDTSCFSFAMHYLFTLRRDLGLAFAYINSS